MAADVVWWRRPFPNLWVGLGTVGSVLFMFGPLGPDRHDQLAVYGLLTVCSLVVLGIGVVSARRPPLV
jgi:hypothetical protein